MDIVKILGGYDSWQFTVVALGLIIIGGGLTVLWKLYLLPLLISGEFLLFLYMNNLIRIDNVSGYMGGEVGIMPIIYVIICVMTNFIMLYKVVREEKYDHQ